MPRLKIESWKYLKTTHLEKWYSADDGAPLAQETSQVSTVIEKVRASFEIVDGEDFNRSKTWKQDKGQRVRPLRVFVEFRSANKAPWSVEYGTKVQAHNVKKDGSLGAIVELSQYDWAEWLKELVERRDGDGRTEALDWVRAEYPLEDR